MRSSQLSYTPKGDDQVYNGHESASHRARPFSGRSPTGDQLPVASWRSATSSSSTRLSVTSDDSRRRDLALRSQSR